MDNIAKEYKQLEVHNVYEKHIDERYFFKIFGDDYWTEISAEEYFSAKKSTKEYAIPNDNELTVTPIKVDDYTK